MSEKNYEIKVIKIGFLGDSGAGKTDIIKSFLNIDDVSNSSNERYETKYVLKNGKEIKLILWDTAGHERFRSIALKTLRFIQGVILVYDITTKESFQHISYWLDEIKENPEKPFIVLFGNKIDSEKEKWKVSTEEAKDYAESKNLPYFEVSAKTKQGLNEGFSYIINEIYEKLYSKSKNINLEKNVDDKKGCVGNKNVNKKENVKK